MFAGWAHVVCALYIPEVSFGNVTTMEPIILKTVPPDRFTKVFQFTSQVVLTCAAEAMTSSFPGFLLSQVQTQEALMNPPPLRKFGGVKCWGKNNILHYAVYG